MMKRTNRIIVSFLAIICCLAGSILPVFALETTTPRVTFVNEAKIAPDLYVSKVLSNEGDYWADNGQGEGQMLPEFTFLLELGTESAAAGDEEYAPAGRKAYTVILADGTEKKEDGNLITYYTDGGYFNLRPGETAWFKDIGLQARYRLTEEIPESLKGRFERVLKEGETPAKEGTVNRRGASETFTNRYIPRGNDSTTTLSITKSVLSAPGYTFPEEAIFQFSLQLNREPYKNKDYIIKDVAGNFLKSENTGEEGIVFLPGRCTAVFTEVPVNGDYRVEEINLPSGWRAVGGTIKEGPVQANMEPLTFINTKAAFYVAKSLSGTGGSMEDTFTFLLKKGQGESAVAWLGAEYYLYDMDTKQLVEQQPKRSEDGTFELKPGQLALFINMEEGTYYSVSEEKHSDYTQTYPLQTEGYVDYRVSDTVRELRFENEYVDKENVLSVTKRITPAVAEDVPNADEPAEFTFVLEKKVGEGIYEPVPDTTVYNKSVGGEDDIQNTVSGEFVLSANETAYFKELDYNQDYRVREIRLPKGYLTKSYLAVEGEEEMEGIIDPEAGDWPEGRLERGGSVDFTFTNTYVADKLDLQLIKTDKRGTARLRGATFTLKNADGEEVGTYTTDGDGLLTFEGLAAGDYTLEEIDAPQPYTRIENPILITITRSKIAEDPAYITIKAGLLTVSSEKKEDTLEPGSKPEVPVTNLQLIQNEGERSRVEVTIYNEFLYTLPRSGGRGIYLYVIAGTVLMLLASGIYMLQRKAVQ